MNKLKQTISAKIILLVCVLGTVGAGACLSLLFSGQTLETQYTYVNTTEVKLFSIEPQPYYELREDESNSTMFYPAQEGLSLKEGDKVVVVMHYSMSQPTGELIDIYKK